MDCLNVLGRHRVLSAFQNTGYQRSRMCSPTLRVHQSVSAGHGDGSSNCSDSLNFSKSRYSGERLLQGIYPVCIYEPHKAHNEAVDSLSENGASKLGTRAAVVAAANAMSPSLLKNSKRLSVEGELHHFARGLCACDSTIKEMVEKLFDNSEATVSASAAHAMDRLRRSACTEIARLTYESQKLQESSTSALKLGLLAFPLVMACLYLSYLNIASEDKAVAPSKEKDELLKDREVALREAHLWRFELRKARESVVILEGAVVRADERVKVAEAYTKSKGSCLKNYMVSKKSKSC